MKLNLKDILWKTIKQTKTLVKQNVLVKNVSVQLLVAKSVVIVVKIIIVALTISVVKYKRSKGLYFLTSY